MLIGRLHYGERLGVIEALLALAELLMMYYLIRDIT